MVGVYLITNKVNGKVYVGSASVSAKARFHSHRHGLRRGAHHSKHLQASWDKYGEDQFTFEVIEECEPSECVTREQFHLDRLQSYDNRYGYNICKTAGNCLGFKHSDDAKRKMSAAKKGRKLTKEHAAAMSLSLKGRKLSDAHIAKIKESSQRPETRAKKSEALRGRPVSEKVRQALAEANSRRELTPEHKEILRQANLGRKLNPKHVAAIVKANKGRPLTEEHKKKLADAQTGKKFSKESREKMALKARLAWVKRKQGI